MLKLIIQYIKGIKKINPCCSMLNPSQVQKPLAGTKEFLGRLKNWHSGDQK